jgi:hypothetical protein
VGIPMSIHCTPLLADLSLFPYEAQSIRNIYMRKINLFLWPSIQHLDIQFNI